ncbi:MAG: ABC transporter transmembrane domain-containing protein, partial [Lachnospiraceae bacterium]|nr:ABC transporter transmembrane domain-containing protein [Lachnospiraceae bacterium]
MVVEMKKGYRGKIVLYALLQLLQGALALLPPYCYLIFLNRVIMERRFEKLFAVLSLYLLVFAGNTLVSVLGKRMYYRIFPAMQMEMKEKVLEKYSGMDIEMVQKYTAGELKERLHKDT